ncbi:MAG: TIGR03960 family B12-binding radical SAM protein [Ruminococcaceae bacterium]|nr:TIGR03960 family B12-binding radical SAM protein [Oscillospiraceae bacterium]
MDNKKLEELFLKAQKPGRYSGNEQGSIIKDKNKVDIRFAFCFPDTYEIGMSHLGMKILYSLFNSREDIWCERVFAPWIDFRQVMIENHIPLFALESRDPVKDFDFIGFTLQYEMSYTNVLSMLDLAGLPLKSKERNDLSPIVVAGGPCACNAEPIAEFIDIFFLGEGEEVDLEVIDLYKEYKTKGATKEEFLKAAAKIEGVYVPSLYTVEYEDEKIKSITPKEEAPATVKKRIIKDLDKVHYPKEFVVPYIEIVHDRAVQEIYRGCIRGCRFCQAGFIYRPVRQKSADVISEQAKDLCASTGYDEISLSSLSTSDYTELEPLLNKLLDWTDEEKVSLSLPSLRIDNFSPELLAKINHIRKSGLTFAPEAGTQRLRDVINKNITEQEILDTCRIAFEGGHTSVKLYFMIGLPTETDEDIKGIADLAQKIVDIYYSIPNRRKGKGVDVGVSVSTFVPKPFTPFQFEPQISREEILRRQEYLRSCITTKKVSLSWHDSATSFLEGVFARGDRRLSAVIEEAYRRGCIFDGWSECFALEKWLKVFADLGIDPKKYSERSFTYDEILPWEHLDYAVTKDFFIKQNKLAKEAVTTPNCRISCAACGANCYKEGVCFEKR